MPAVVDEDECVGCEVCVDECPNEAISMENDLAKVDESKCDDCGTCVDACPTEAITVK
ncbi:MAG: 4Fe-4S binding protein [Halobacteriota archaeon]|nr:4Fe-4S binding protein [Halobacteriota archaeon]